MNTPSRFQLRRVLGWRKPENGVSVARPHRWKNPHDVDVHGRDEAIRLFRVDLEAGTLLVEKTGERLNIAKARDELRGKSLGCYCRLDEDCHADVLLREANR